MYINDVDIVRAVIEDRINDTVNYYVASFYMGAKEDEVERYAETFMKMLDDSNLTQYRGRLIVKNDGESEISSLRLNYANSFGFNVEIDCSQANSPYIMDMAHQLIEDTKGRKFDCIIDSDSVVYVSIPCDNTYAEDKNYFLVSGFDVNANYKTVIEAMSLSVANLVVNDILYLEETATGSTKGNIYMVKVATKSSSAITVTLLDTFTVNTYRKRKISIALTEVTGNIPFVVNKIKHMRYNLSGKATVCDDDVELGNDTVKVEMSSDNVTYYEIEPLSLPSDVDLNGEDWRETASSPRKKYHNSEQSNKREYDMVADYSTLGTIFRNLANYGSYGNGITANTKWYVKETITNYGYRLTTTVYGVIDKISRSNTNGDVMIYKISLNLEG